MSFHRREGGRGGLKVGTSDLRKIFNLTDNKPRMNEETGLEFGQNYERGMHQNPRTLHLSFNKT